MSLSYSCTIVIQAVAQRRYCRLSAVTWMRGAPAAAPLLLLLLLQCCSARVTRCVKSGISMQHPASHSTAGSCPEVMPNTARPAARAARTPAQAAHVHTCSISIRRSRCCQTTRPTRPHTRTCWRVLNHDDFMWLQAQQLQALEVGVGVWLGPLTLLPQHNCLKVIVQPQS